MVTRRVVILLGPPGAGKTTRAATYGLDVYDRDDPQWHDSEALFRAELRRLARDPHAQAVVIRTGTTRAAQQAAIDMCRATEVEVIATPPDVCARRVRARARGDVAAQLAGIERWWANHQAEAADGVTSRRW